MAVSDLIDRVRRPEYTGTNRCVPCTIVNVVLAIGTAVLLATVLFYGGIDPVIAGGSGVVIILGGGGTIYLRGYLVPGTPELTKRFFPDWILRYFDKMETDQRVVSDIDPESLLKEADALQECELGEDLCLTDAFRSEWYGRITERRSGDTTHSDLAELLGRDRDAIEFSEHDEAFVASLEERRIGQWESDGAFVADMAAAAALEDRIPTWSEINLEDRSNLLKGLRAFLERCPICDGEITMDEEVVESCCRSIDVVAITCDSCDRRIFETEHPG